MTVPPPDHRKEHIRQQAIELGFAACTFTSSASLGCGATVSAWLEEGRHGLMDYLARDPERRLQPLELMAGARSIVVTAFRYPPGPAPDPHWREKLTGRIAAYARGKDYHSHVGERLRELATRISRSSGGRFEVHVDAGPLVEKELARRAGLGWYGHNTNVLTKSFGSYFLLGCLLTNLELEPDAPFVENHCGDCRACIPACPTGALNAGPTIDARRCISYLTIEMRGPIPPSLRPLVGNWVFGCDDCQTVCPWNDASPSAGDDFLAPSLPRLLALGEAEFDEIYRETAVARVRRRGMARNAALALGNSRNSDALDPLVRALREDTEPLVRSAAAWAIGNLGIVEGRRALERLDLPSLSPPIASEVRAALARLYAPDDTLSSPPAAGVV